MSAAAEDFARGNILWRAGEHEAAIAAFERAVAGDPDLLDAANNLGNALVAIGRAVDAVGVYRAAFARAPERGDLAYNLGNALMAAGQPAEAETAYRAALAVRPDHAGAHNNRGNVLRALGRHAEALGCYAAALALRPDFAGTLDNMAATLLALHRPQDAEPLLRRALAAAPDHAEACNNLGGALLALDRPAEALPWFRRAVALAPPHPQARFGEGLALLSLGDYRAGWRAYAARWDDPRFTVDVPAYTTPIWTGGGAVAGKRMLLHAEQGLGDTIQFARYTKLLRQRGAHVVLQVQQPLARLLAPLGDEIVAVGDLPASEPVPPHDLRCPLLSLPQALGTRLATIPADIPYLIAPPDRVAAWGARLGPATGRRVGLAFSGSPDHPDDALRSIPATALLPALAGCEVHVVQRDIRPPDAAALAGARVHAADLTDFTEAAALLAWMDLVITVDTSIAHLAGALGRPVWVLLQHAADFRWLRQRTDSPWYPTALLFRQTTRGDWAGVIAEIAAALTTSRHPP